MHGMEVEWHDEVVRVGLGMLWSKVLTVAAEHACWIM